MFYLAYLLRGIIHKSKCCTSLNLLIELNIAIAKWIVAAWFIDFLIRNWNQSLTVRDLNHLNILTLLRTLPFIQLVRGVIKEVSSSFFFTISLCYFYSKNAALYFTTILNKIGKRKLKYLQSLIKECFFKKW